MMANGEAPAAASGALLQEASEGRLGLPGEVVLTAVVSAGHRLAGLTPQASGPRTLQVQEALQAASEGHRLGALTLQASGPRTLPVPEALKAASVGQLPGASGAPLLAPHQYRPPAGPTATHKVSSSTTHHLLGLQSPGPRLRSHLSLPLSSPLIFLSLSLSPLSRPQFPSQVLSLVFLSFSVIPSLSTWFLTLLFFPSSLSLLFPLSVFFHSSLSLVFLLFFFQFFVDFLSILISSSFPFLFSPSTFPFFPPPGLLHTCLGSGVAPHYAYLPTCLGLRAIHR